MIDGYRKRCADAAMKAWGEQAVLCDHSQIIPIGSIVDAVLGERDDEMEGLGVELELARTTRDETHIWTNTNWKERAEQAHAEADQLRAELERRITADAEALADQTLMRGMSVKDGAVNLDLIPPREIAAIWVHCAVGMLRDAPNYTETRVDMPKVSLEISPAGTLDRYALIVQRVGKLTPHEARQAAEAERDHLARTLEEAVRQRDALNAAADRVLELHRMSDATGTCMHCSENDYPNYEVPWPCPTVRALNPKESQ